MRTGLIYKFTNRINNKIYVGQTTCKLQDRVNKHLQDSYSDEFYFHRALKKYGIDNFNIDIL